jgi:hypothetical protein
MYGYRPVYGHKGHGIVANFDRFIRLGYQLFISFR